ncbi:MAG TPA: hypothetical protein VJQ83_04500 [Tepidiformaceae bacterium]|nr:hypothetical protein [Tepidiformaceae bacterium]
MNAVRGIGIAFTIFVVSFALHIVGGATGQGWLFGIAVALIFLTATGFPVIALWMGELRTVRSGQGRATAIAGGLIGIGLTASALWAANGRSVAWWELPAAIAMVAVMSLVLLALGRGWLILRGKDQPRRTPLGRKEHEAESDERASTVVGS